MCAPGKQVLAVTEPETAKLRETGVQLGPWCAPKGYRVKSGAQLH
ncbi:hypothetical protein DUNSADRAFT_18319 [Dunaliella salina]|uniref:Uncharacterized protein n=1 Tax=Dunaliella salina TaxID=3046 RepID=A0ABQ7GZ63_DUNSA|nr:hypothetical protein DUNSADRAFT_18319 [Dunaliella salina]|eukprot:KAF5839905.1 hypothetical protein DUNSADRAFT_18319 [Dunaliella salina]